MRVAQMAAAAVIASMTSRVEAQTFESFQSEMVDAMVRCAAVFEEASAMFEDEGKHSSAELFDRQANGARLSAILTLATSDVRQPSEETVKRATAEVESRIDTARLVYAALKENNAVLLDDKLGDDIAFCAQPHIREFQTRVVGQIRRLVY